MQGYLVANHLPREDLEDVVLYCKYHCLLAMSAEQRVGQLVIWREVGFFYVIFTFIDLFIEIFFFFFVFCIFAQLSQITSFLNLLFLKSLLLIYSAVQPYRSFSLSRNKKINWKPSSGRSQENEML